MSRPYSFGKLCVAAGDIGNRLFPNGILLVSEQDTATSLADLKAKNAKRGFMPVNAADADNTIWGDASLVYLVRAWHDSCHILGSYPFTAVGEARATYMMCADLLDYWYDDESTYQPPHTSDMTFALSLLLADYLGMAQHGLRSGGFITNKKAWAEEEASRWKDEAAALLFVYTEALSEGKHVARRRVIDSAKKWGGKA